MILFFRLCYFKSNNISCVTNGSLHNCGRLDFFSNPTGIFSKADCVNVCTHLCGEGRGRGLIWPDNSVGGARQPILSKNWITDKSELVNRCCETALCQTNASKANSTVSWFHAVTCRSFHTMSWVMSDRSKSIQFSSNFIIENELFFSPNGEYMYGNFCHSDLAENRIIQSLKKTYLLISSSDTQGFKYSIIFKKSISFECLLQCSKLT